MSNYLYSTSFVFCLTETCPSCSDLQKIFKLSKTDYQEICSLLNIDPSEDWRATKILSKMLTFWTVKKTKEALKKLIKGKIVLIFGAGPSLEETLEQLRESLPFSHDNITTIAVDGAANALLEKNIPITALVSDLDGCFNLLQKNILQTTIKVIHAHGDNIQRLLLLKDIVQKGRFIGTTQTKETLKVRNYGGFTDGDRAAYLAANFHAKAIILFGFDFGAIVGRYSKPDEHTGHFSASARKLLKFKIAKKLLTALPQHFPESSFFNATINSSLETSLFQTIEIEKVVSLLPNERHY
ncbi:6-hydroxymethyl-7,8-dihydropterin pyrophosphokinase [Candidatus Heimdallarchaeota archaeon]|nr:MAG: 6-hydroxymethyl-7,8-dihydropterin pyrophosphokinase [Candidatus Gerdarchaeota archaeon]RLI69879.1 MAG: 6-hydroxymethyl-7,8-dihydropterin pyrophosphokinase [Candidatus Gerdarchaeota archaeon]RLI73108.1 MAG: 6-hydroxymethyl-7,8-dihydropterin pyrophosphokinase [Candidatus Heimdallarchaeota archaeon]